MAAGIAMLTELKKNPPYEKLETYSQRLEVGLREAASAAKMPHVINRVGSMWTFFFTSNPVTDYDSAKLSDTKMFSKFFWAMMDRGVYLPCSQFEAAFNSVTHDDDIIDLTLKAARESFAEINS
jgi:glutamate-1-semialdehyde 2,1-aminomutase